MLFESTLIIETDHPSTQGHFPGYPIVPAAYLLSLIANTIKTNLGGKKLVKINKTKFVAAAKPGQQLSLSIKTTEEKVNFTVKHNENTLITGKGVLG